MDAIQFRVDVDIPSVMDVEKVKMFVIAMDMEMKMTMKKPMKTIEINFYF